MANYQRHKARAWLLGGILACSLMGATVARADRPPVLTLAETDSAPELLLFQDLPVIVAAGKREQTQREAAASVSVVNAEDIRLFGYRSLADILRGQRSFYIFSDGLNQLAGARGFLRPGEWNARILVLVDGRPTREMIYSQTHLDRDFVVPIESIQRVEIVRGPGSALYGGNAVFGVINVVTRTGAEINGLQIKAEGGTQYTGRLSALYGKRLDSGWDIVINASGFTSEGDQNIKYQGINDAAHNFGHIRNADHEDVEAIYIKAQKSELTLSLDYEIRDKGNRTANYDVSWFNPGQMQEHRFNATAKWDHELSETQSIHAMAYYGVYRYHQYYDLNDESTGVPYHYVTGSFNDWVGGEAHYDWQALETVHFLAGVDAQQSIRTHQHDYDTLNGEDINVNQGLGYAGAFTEAQWQATPWLSLIAGGRADYIQRIGSILSPRFAAILTPTKQDTFKLLYGRAFRAPNLYEMFYAAPGVEPNTNLKPEIVDTYEAVYERQFAGGVRTSINGYIWNMSDALGNMAGDTVQNMGSARAYGVEAEIEKHWQSGARIRAYATATCARNDMGPLPHSPAWITGFSAAIPVINKRTFLAIEPQIVGPQKSDTGVYTGPTFLTNIIFTSQDITKNVDFQLGAYNVFSEFAHTPHGNQFYQVQPTLNPPHTQIMASLTFRF